MSAITQRVFHRLLEALGPQDWWPADSPFEVMVGAVLVQNTSWKNVERAIDNLRAANLLDPRRLLELPVSDLEDSVRPAGYFRVKVRRLRSLAEFVVERYDGSIDAMRAADEEQLRRELLAVHGVGPETADSILLYALDKPVLVVDAYTHRIWARHGWIGYDADYRQLQAQLAAGIPHDSAQFNELHALLVAVGNRYCRKTPKCDQCPLCDMLPDGGVRQPA